jgi:hypothetical protein
LDPELKRLRSIEQSLEFLDIGFVPPASNISADDRLNRVDEFLQRKKPADFQEFTQRFEITPASPAGPRLSRASEVILTLNADFNRSREIKQIALFSLAAVAGIGVLAGLVRLGVAYGRRKHHPSGAKASASITAPDPPAPAPEGAPAQRPASPSPLTEPKQRQDIPASADTPPATTPMIGQRLFISFSTSDLDFVANRLAPALRAAGHQPWFSAVSIRPSDLWERSILTGLEECDWFLIVMSPHAVSSKWVQLETHWATEHRDGRIIPLMIVRCDPWKLHMKLGNLQYVDFERSPDALADLLDIIRTRSHTALPPRP